jgi:hypothetical protein
MWRNGEKLLQDAGIHRITVPGKSPVQAVGETNHRTERITRRFKQKLRPKVNEDALCLWAARRALEVRPGDLGSRDMALSRHRGSESTGSNILVDHYR